MTLSVLTYNTRLLGFPSNLKNAQRANEIKNRILQMDSPPDVVVLQEVFANKARTVLLEGRKQGLFGGREGGLLQAGYSETARPNKPGRFRNGGVMILSRLGFESKDTDVFENATIGGRRQAKGVVHAAVRKDGQQYHIFGTHTQGGGCGPLVIARRRDQIREMGGYIRKRIGDSEDPVIVTGDLNVGGCSDIRLSDVPHLIRQTEESDVTGPEVSRVPMLDPTHYSTLNNETLDHFYVSKGRLDPAVSSVRRLDWTSRIAERDSLKGTTKSGETDYFLSDHHPLHAELGFLPPEPGEGYLAGRIRRGSWSDTRRFCAALIFSSQDGRIQRRVMASDGQYEVRLPEGRYHVDVLTAEGESRVSGEGFVVVTDSSEPSTYNILLD